MASDKTKKTESSAPAPNAASGERHYLIQQGREMYVLQSATFPNLAVEPGQKIQKVIAAHERRDLIDRVIARQQAEAGLKLRD